MGNPKSQIFVRIMFLSYVMLILTGCASSSIPVAYQCPSIVLPSETNLNVSGLNEKSRPDEVIKAYVADLTNSRAWIKAVKEETSTVPGG